MASRARTAQTPGASPNAGSARPQHEADTAIASPCRRIPFIHPLVADTTNAPADGAANIRPAAHGVPSKVAMNGISAFGKAKIIAARSARYEPSRSFREAAYRRP